MPNEQRVALFIDAENTSPTLANGIVGRSKELGKLTIARCYGKRSALTTWNAAMTRHHLVPVQTPPGSVKDNGSDFMLTIDAVSLLHRGRFDHAVIASSDADFTLLAMHIREHGKGVDGVGEAKAKPSLKTVFDHFTIVGGEAPERPAAKPAARKTPARTAAKPTSHAEIDHPWLKAVFEKTRGNASACHVQALGRALAKERPDYKKGYRTLNNFLQKSGLFEIEGTNVHLKGSAH